MKRGVGGPYMPWNVALLRRPDRRGASVTQSLFSRLPGQPLAPPHLPLGSRVPSRLQASRQVSLLGLAHRPVLPPPPPGAPNTRTHPYPRATPNTPPAAKVPTPNPRHHLSSTKVPVQGASPLSMGGSLISAMAMLAASRLAAVAARPAATAPPSAAAPGKRRCPTGAADCVKWRRKRVGSQASARSFSPGPRTPPLPALVLPALPRSVRSAARPLLGCCPYNKLRIPTRQMC